MFVRGYQMSDCKEITELFYNTVHTINAKDYTKEQLDVWATGQADLEKWNQSLQEHYSTIAYMSFKNNALLYEMQKEKPIAPRIWSLFLSSYFSL